MKCLGRFRFNRKCKCKFRRPKTYSTVSAVEMEERKEERGRRDLPLKGERQRRSVRARARLGVGRVGLFQISQKRKEFGSAWICCQGSCMDSWTHHRTFEMRCYFKISAISISIQYRFLGEHNWGSMR